LFYLQRIALLTNSLAFLRTAFCDPGKPFGSCYVIQQVNYENVIRIVVEICSHRFTIDQLVHIFRQELVQISLCRSLYFK